MATIVTERGPLYRDGRVPVASGRRCKYHRRCMTGWYLRTLGRPRLEREGLERDLERKTAALLTYLACEGPTPRSRLAGLLWPDSGEATARNNLSQLLRRLRLLAGGELVVADQALRLAPELRVDVVELRLAAFEGELDAGRFTPELLDGVDYDDVPEFMDWLLAERESLLALQRDALLQEVEALARAGAYREAAESAELLLELDPVSEEAHRRVMRFHYLAGDRAAALGAYERCRELLQRELGVAPMEQTERLAADIEAGARLERAPATVRPSIPLQVLRPPVLAGRDRELQRMANALAAGRAVFVRGAAGLGKTRLLDDFARRQGVALYASCRPADRDASYAGIARLWRRLLAERRVELAPWERRALGRVLPELAPDEGAGAGSLAELLEAQLRLLHVAHGAGFDLLVLDDLQFADRATVAAIAHLASTSAPADAADVPAPGLLFGFRPEEVSAEHAAVVDELVAEAHAVVVDLAPLTEEESAALLAGLEVTATAGREAELHRHAGGNPFYLVETVRQMLDQGAARAAGALPVPESLGARLERRLAQLPGAARHLAWAAAVIGGRFELELAAEVLERDPLDLAEPLAALERAQVFGDGGFSHDLLAEAAAAQAPAAVRSLLHARSARALQRRGARPGVVAAHLLAAGDERAAAPLLSQAAQEAELALDLAAAERDYGRAGELFAAHGASAEAFEARRQQTHLVVRYLDADEGRRLAERLEAEARTPLQRAQALHLVSFVRLAERRWAEAEALERQGLALLDEEPDPDASAVRSLRVELVSNVAAALFNAGRADEAAAAFEEAAALAEASNDPDHLPTTLSNLAFVRDTQRRQPEAWEVYRAADAAFARAGRYHQHVVLLNNWSYSLRSVGQARRSFEPLARAQELLREYPPDAHVARSHAAQRGTSHAQLGELAPARADLRQALEMAARRGVRLRDVELTLAEVHLYLGELEAAAALLAALRDDPDAPPRERANAALLEARLGAAHLALGAAAGDPEAALARGRELVGEEGAVGVELLLAASEVAAVTGDAERAAAAAARAAELARAGGYDLYLAAAAVRGAAADLAAGRAREALARLAAADEAMRRRDALAFYLPEAAALRHAALAALGEPAGAALHEAVRQVRDVAEALPAELREAFLTRNRVNRSVLGHAGTTAGHPPVTLA